MPEKPQFLWKRKKRGPKSREFQTADGPNPVNTESAKSDKNHFTAMGPFNKEKK